jgi:AMP-binding enzyme
MNSNLALNLTGVAQADGQRPALRLGQDVLSYAELDEATARAAGLLHELGVGPGDRVGVMLPNVPCFAFVYYVRRPGRVTPSRQPPRLRPVVAAAFRSCASSPTPCRARRADRAWSGPTGGE